MPVLRQLGDRPLSRAFVWATARGRKRLALHTPAQCHGRLLIAAAVSPGADKGGVRVRPAGAAGRGSMCAVPPLSAAILSICIWRAATKAPRRACSLPPPPDPRSAADKPQNGLLLG